MHHRYIYIHIYIVYYNLYSTYIYICYHIVLNDIFSASDYVAELSLRQVTPRPRAEKVVRCAGDKALKDRWNSVGKTGSSA